jgi:hypothetical protein
MQIPMFHFSVYCICSCCNIIMRKKLGIMVQINSWHSTLSCLDYSTENRPCVTLQQQAGHRLFILNHGQYHFYRTNFLHTNGRLMYHDSIFTILWHICNEKGAKITLAGLFLTACNNFSATEFHGILQTFRHTQVSVKITVYNRTRVSVCVSP